MELKSLPGSIGGIFEAYTEYDEVPGASFKADVVTLDGISYYP